MAKDNKIKKSLGPIFTIAILTILIMIVSTIFFTMEIGGQKTSIINNSLTTSLVTVQNIFTKEGIKYIFSNAVVNYRMFEPLVLVIISLIGISICEKSGLLKIITQPLKKIKPYLLTALILFISVISTIIGDYSYALLIPLIAIIYKYLNKDPIVGIITVFIGLTIGYGTGIIYNYSDYSLGMLTEAAAVVNVDKNYKFILTSNIYIMLASTLVLTFSGASIIENMIAEKFKKKVYEDEIIMSRKSLYITIVAFVIMIIGVIYMIFPGSYGSGILLDNTKTHYIQKLFSETAPFKDGIVYLITIIMAVCGFVYGFHSKNIKDSSDYSIGLSKSFDDVGYVFVLMFASSIMIGILNWTNLGEVVAVNLVEFLGVLQFSGIPLIIALFLIVVLMSILIPSTISKWILLSPVVIPLFMKSNITPDFTQFIFKAADGVGKIITPFFIYFPIMIGFLEKYNTDENNKISIFGTLKLLFRPTLILLLIWILILVGWYIIGLPIGNKIYPTL